MTKNDFEFEVLVNGSPVKEYIKDGKIYIEGRKNTNFSIRIRNNSWTRKLFVPTVDGLSVLNGETGDYSSRGYIVEGRSAMTIDGWRTSDKAVAQFFFTNADESYAEKTDKGGNLGVIGCAVFSEKVKERELFNQLKIESTKSTPPVRIWEFPYVGDFGGTMNPKMTTNNVYLCGSQMNSYTSASNAGTNKIKSFTAQSIGTGFGSEKRSEVISVEFDRESSPTEVFCIFYNTREQLKNLGIDFNSKPQYVTPSAFPGEWCKPPKK